MGKPIISQKRGKGSPAYRAPSHRYVADVRHRPYDDHEKTKVIYGRIIDFVHCSGHNAPLAKVLYENGEKSYIIAPEKIKVNDIIASGTMAPVEMGNTLPLEKLPEGTLIYNIENTPGDGGKFVRSTGMVARVVGKIRDKITVVLPSKTIKEFNPKCRATIGITAGSGRKDKPFLKAGKRFAAMRGRNKVYPKVSGVAMNAYSHPFGSGRGRHIGKTKVPKRNAPPGRNVGLIRASRTGKRR